MKTAMIVSAAMMALPAATFAATYHYVDTTGTVRTIEAPNAAAAFDNAANIAPHSGVTLDQNLLETGDQIPIATAAGMTTSGGMASYRYVDTNGTVREVVAASPSAALMLATDRDPNSGVLVYQGEVHIGQEVSGM